MDSFVQYTGIGVPLQRSNVDTDQIIPSAYLKSVSRHGFEDALFAEWRKDPDFILNREPYSTGSVLVAGPDFGTGSSREHAVWALKDFGFRAVLSSRFADIFRGNAGKQGLVAAEVEQSDIEKIWDRLDNHPYTEVAVDLKERTVVCGEMTVRFRLDDYTRWRLIEGMDDIDLTLRTEEQITAFEHGRPMHKPTTLPIGIRPGPA